MKIQLFRIYFAILLVVLALGFTPRAGAEDEFIYIVTTTEESGAGSLNEAITTAIYNIPFTTKIHFNIPGEPPFIIRPQKRIHDIPAPVIIDATTQPGYAGMPLVVLDGSDAEPGASGIKFFWTGESTLRGMSVHSFDMAQVHFDQKGGNAVEGCWIGVDAATGKIMRHGAHGVFIYDSPDNRVGGAALGARNLIAGPRFGITIEGAASRGNVVMGNSIGVDFACVGAPALSICGVALVRAPDNVIGGAGRGEGNAIAGAPVGVVIDGPGTAGNRVLGNHFGVTDESPHEFLEDVHIIVKDTTGAVIGGEGGAANIFGPSGRGPIAYNQATPQDNEILGNITLAPPPATKVGAASPTAGISSRTLAGLPIEVTVTNINDSGAGSLRQAIITLNNSSDGGTVIFNIPGDPPFTIQPISPFPHITKPAIIDGTTQSGYAGVPLIEINGNFAGANADGFKFTAGSSGVKGLCINRFSADGCVHFSGGSNNIVQGCYLGVSLTGEAVYTRKTNHGVFVWNSSNNQIGGGGSNEGNLIAGNIFGVTLEGAASTGNTVMGNLIGVTPDGSAAPGNLQNGIFILGAPGNTIGGTTPAARNIICGNQAGVVIDGAGASGNLIRGNLIGTTSAGASGLGNTIHGVFVIGAAGNQIGAAVAGGRNIISANEDFGLTIEGATANNNVIVNNWIGLALDGGPLGNANHGVYILQANNNTIGGNPGAPNIIAYNGKDGVLIPSGTGNVIRANSIHSHPLLGIDLGDGLLDPDGVTLNDEEAMDADTGPNLRQNYPKIMTVSATTNKVTGTLVTKPNQTFTVEFFASSECNPSGHGEGERLVGSVTVMTDAMGTTIVDTTLTSPLSDGEYLTSTATDSQGNTSEFSQCLLVGDAGAHGYFVY